VREVREEVGSWLMYFRYKNEHRIFKPVEIAIRKGLRYKEEKQRR
jgi:hypothetical protein